MTQTADDLDVPTPRGTRDAAALFVVVREDRRAADVRFIGEFSGNAAHSLPDVVRQIMRRAPALVHLDLREVTSLDEQGVKQLAHTVRICRRHGAMVRITASPAVESAVEAAGAASALGILPRSLREYPTAGNRRSPNGSGGPALRS
jgi:anti-anti-sigma factor